MATLTKAEIQHALEALGQLASSQGHCIQLFLVGGAAMVLRFDARESTKDVDAVILAPLPVSLVRGMAERVAAERGWPTDWLNDGAKGFVNECVAGDVLFEAPGILVRAAPIQQLLSMKLAAWRDDVDMADAETLIERMAGDREGVWREIVGYLPHGTELKARYAFEQLWDATRGDHDPAT